jgi:hypothetical protein
MSNNQIVSFGAQSKLSKGEICKMISDKLRTKEDVLDFFSNYG